MGRFRAIGTFVVAAAVAGCNSSNAIPNQPASLHTIKHVVIMLQENRSFDNIFAGFPGADTTLTGACKPAPWCKTGTAPLTPVSLETTDRLGLGTDIDHSHHGFEVECDFDSAAGACRNDGFDKIRFGESGTGELAKLYPYAYVERSESKPYWDIAGRYALADHMFFTETASSFIAHQIILSGTVALNSKESLTDEPNRQPWGCDAPAFTTTPILHSDGKESLNGPFPCFTQWGTMADLLDAADVSWKYYVDDFQGKNSDFSGGVWDGYDAIKKVRYGADWKNVSMPNTTVFSDLKNGTLPSVSWLIPTLADSDHPASGCNHGPQWVTTVIDTIGKSKYWNDTAIILLWDDWGGWYDNVPPAQTNYTSLGFRVPMILISPYARPKYISSTPYQFGSILKYVEQNFGLGSLHTTDESSTSIGDMFDYTQKPTPFVSEPIPKVKSCMGAPTAQEIIEHDGGVPE